MPTDVCALVLGQFQDSPPPSLSLIPSSTIDETEQPAVVVTEPGLGSASRSENWLVCFASYFSPVMGRLKGWGKVLSGDGTLKGKWGLQVSGTIWTKVGLDHWTLAQLCLEQNVPLHHSYLKASLCHCDIVPGHQ